MPGSFEHIYLKLRDNEHRLYSDEVVRELPNLYDKELLRIPSIAKEWKVRARSAEKLIHYLSKRSTKSILEVGCGNGWLCHQLAAAFPSRTVLGIDINETELQQGQRVFGKLHTNLTFKNEDIFNHAFSVHRFDCILIAGALQYFPDLKKLFGTLQSLLAPHGEIHVMDSPVYKTIEKTQAKMRSDAYFDQRGCPEMKRYYHHHSWKEFEDFSYRIQYDPSTLWNKVVQKTRSDSPFPWVIILQVIA